MKKLYLIILSLACFTCQDSETNPQTYVHLSRDVGAGITSEEAQRWTNRFQFNSRLKEMSGDFAINRQELQNMISDAGGCDGLFFFNGLEDDKHHIVSLPVKNDRLVWGAIIVDCNNSTTIDSQTAKQWYENYKSKNLNSTWGYFFGANVFDEILANDFLQKITLVPAVNDENIELLVIYPWDNEGNVGRSKDQASAAYDHSFLCPSNCPQ